ncbi:MAG: hypothetical protein RJB62_1717 [Pseudomonadota bacterium]|jgi:uncharacterized protein GlcG (DUF336 family)
MGSKTGIFRKTGFGAAAAAAMFTMTGLASAQPADSFVERKIVTSEAARRILDTCLAMAAEYPTPISVAVVDPFGILIDFHSMQGSSETSGTTALLKAKTAARWRRTTAEVNEMVVSGLNRSPEWIGDFPQPGAVPILIDGEVAGAVGVGGLAANFEYGEPCARAGIDAVFGAGFTPQ